MSFSWIAVFAILVSPFSGIPSLAPPVTAQSATPVAASSEEFAGTLSDRSVRRSAPPVNVRGHVLLRHHDGAGELRRAGWPPDSNFIRGAQELQRIATVRSDDLSQRRLRAAAQFSNITWMSQVWEDVQYRDVILFDQRGTKHSNRLNCDPYRFGFNYLLENDAEFQDLWEEIQSLTDEDLPPKAVLQIVYQASRRRVDRSRHRYHPVQQRQQRHDIFALVNALGYDEVNLVGISYGTRLALTAMRDHPQQIRSVVIDSVYPPEINGIEWFPRQADEQINRIVTTCENDRECNRAFPNFRENVLAFSEALAENNPDALTGLFALFNAVNSFPALAEYLPIIMEEIVSGGDTPVYDAVLNGDLPMEERPEDQPGEGDDMLLEAQDLQETAETLFLMAALDEQESRPGAIWMKNVGAAMAPLSSEENGIAAITLLSLPMYFPEPSFDVLSEFVTQFLPEDSQDDLIADLSELDQSELQYVYDLISDLSDEISQDPSGFTQGAYYAVECHEEAPFNDVQVARDSIADLNFPALGQLALDSSEEIAAVCEIWPKGDTNPIETDPVVSDIPTLILVGDWDTQTPASWGAPLLDFLSNATLVSAPASGHGVMIDSDCSFDIVLAFLASPGSDLNLNCL
ncbi:MAG: alpha/beta hydrolase, partial [Thermomicrobiales bacterium]